MTKANLEKLLNPTKEDILKKLLEQRGSTLSIEDFHHITRVCEFLEECQPIVGIETPPNRSTKTLVDYLKEKFIEYGVNEEQIQIQEYNGALEDNEYEQPSDKTQYNIKIGFPSIVDGLKETIAVSGHLDTIFPNYDWDPEKPDAIPFRRTNEEDDGLRPLTTDFIMGGAEEDICFYGFGLCDMKNVFGLMLQLCKERQLSRTPKAYKKSKEWVKKVDSQFWQKYEIWLTDELEEGSLQNNLDFLSGQYNNFIFIGTGGEEAAGHDGMKHFLHNDEHAKTIDLWVIPEPSEGLADVHKGYAATEIVFDSQTEINSIIYNPLEQTLLFVQEAKVRHKQRKFVRPYSIEDDERLGAPSFNIGTLEGRLEVENNLTKIKIGASGEGGHSSRANELENPIEFISSVYNELKLIYGNAVHISQIQGGTNRNEIPENCSLELVVDDSMDIEHVFMRLIDSIRKNKIDYPLTSIDIEIPENCSWDYEFPLPEGVVLGNITIGDINGDGKAVTTQDYRLIPGQVPSNFQAGSKAVIDALGLNAQVALTRDSYPLHSRFFNLEEGLQKKLLKILPKEQTFPSPVNFSTEGGTIVAHLDNAVPVILSTTSLKQAHKHTEEYITLEQAIGQLKVFDNLFRYAIKNPLRSSKEIDLSAQEMFIKKTGIKEGDVEEHLTWFRGSNIFSVIQIGKDVLDINDNAKKLEVILHDFSRALDLYPVVVIDANEEEIKSIISPSSVKYAITETKINGGDSEKRLATEINQIMSRRRVPIVSSVHQKMSPYDVSKHLNRATNSLKYMLISNSRGIFDKNSKVISRLDLNSICNGLEYGKNLSEEEFLARLSDMSIRGDMISRLNQINDYFNSFENYGTAKRKSVQVVSLGGLIPELFSLEGDGTLIRWGFQIEKYSNFDKIDKDKLCTTLEHAYDSQLKEDYFDMHQDNICRIIVDTDYDGVAVIINPRIETKGNQKVYCINKIAVKSDYWWRQDLPERLKQEVFKEGEEDIFFWRDFEGSPVEEWSERLLRFAQRDGKFTSVDLITHSNGDQMHVYTVGINPYSQEQMSIKPKIMCYNYRAPKSFNK